MLSSRKAVMKSRLLLVPAVLAASTALAHVVLTVKGVHFKTENLDFGQPPVRRGDRFDDGTGGDVAWRPGTKYERGYWSDDEASEARQAADKARLLKASRAAEANGRLGEARGLYAEMQRKGFGAPAFVNGRLELLDTPGIASSEGLAAYLKATHSLSKGLLPATGGPLLMPWIAYAQARSTSDYAAVAARYPRSSRAAAALVMAARGGSVESARTLLRRFPGSRFAWDARGALARADFRAGRLQSALGQYEAQVRTANSPARKTSAYGSIIACLRPAGNRGAIAYAALRWASALDAADPYVARNFLLRTLGRFKGGDAAAFYTRLEKDPKAFADYLELRSSLDLEAKDVLDLAPTARRVAGGTPTRARVDAILARVALARNDPRAAAFARSALEGKGDDRATGLFVLATLDRRKGRLQEAKKGYASILRDHPTSYLAGGARENLAIVDERLGDLAGALDLYRTLGYDDDVAYLADVRMTPAGLADYVAKHPDDRLRYTLAMRYIRKGQWDAAETTLKPFSDARRKQLTVASLYPGTAEEEGGLQDPLATIKALRGLDATLAAAKDDEAKTAATVAIADYYYAHKTLLLYSTPAWKGGRNYTIAFSWNPTVATPADGDALRLHHDEHECYAHAATLYQKVLQEFPKSKVAPHAAYRAAVVLKRLSNMAPYWRWRDRLDDLKAESIRLMDLAAKSPDEAVARKARKYGPVFAQEREEFRKAFADEKPPERRWVP